MTELSVLAALHERCAGAAEQTAGRLLGLDTGGWRGWAAEQCERHVWGVRGLLIDLAAAHRAAADGLRWHPDVGG